jgi:hypothetical protein
VPLRHFSIRRVPRLRDGFGWISPDSALLTQARLHFPPASPFAMNPPLTRTKLDLVGFPWIRPYSLKPIHTARRPHSREPTSHAERLDLLGFPWIRPCSLNPSTLFPTRNSLRNYATVLTFNFIAFRVDFRRPNRRDFRRLKVAATGFCPLRLCGLCVLKCLWVAAAYRSGSYESKLDLVGSTWIRPFPLKPVRTSRHPRPLRDEPTSHENRLDLVECTTRQRSLNRRECTARERIPTRGAPTAWNALRDSVLRTVAERLPRRGWSLNPELQPHTAWRQEPQFPWIRPMEKAFSRKRTQGTQRPGVFGFPSFFCALLRSFVAIPPPVQFALLRFD